MPFDIWSILLPIILLARNQNVFYFSAKEKKEKTEPRVQKKAKNSRREKGFSQEKKKKTVEIDGLNHVG